MRLNKQERFPYSSVILGGLEPSGFVNKFKKKTKLFVSIAAKLDRSLPFCCSVSSCSNFVSYNHENMIFCLIIFLGVQGILRHLCVDAARAGREPGSPRSTSVNDLKVNARINKFCTGYCRRRKTKTLKLTSY